MKKHLVIAALTAALGSALATPSGADEHRKNAEKLIEALRVKESFDQNVHKLVLAQLQAQPGFHGYRDVLLDYYTRYVGWDAVREDVIAEYEKAFTNDELVALTEFYGSELGRKSLTLAPRIEATAYSAGIDRAEENYLELQRLVDAKNEAMKMQ